MVFLIGFMGCGKTTLVNYMTREFNYFILDTDILVEKVCQKNINKIFLENGEEYFREKEREVILNLNTKKKSLIATGGGFPCSQDNIDRLNKKGVTIYLKMSPESLFSRLKEKSNRPMINHLSHQELKRFITQKLRERECFYQKAQHIIKVDTLSLENLSRKVRSVINSI